MADIEKRLKELHEEKSKAEKTRYVMQKSVAALDEQIAGLKRAIDELERLKPGKSAAKNNRKGAKVVTAEAKEGDGNAET